MFYVFLAEGFEETEALAPVDVMRRAKLDVKTVGVTGECVTSSHGVPVKADITITLGSCDGIGAFFGDIFGMITQPPS